MLISVLESLNQPDCLLDIPAYCIVVDLHASNDVVAIQNEHASNRCTSHWIIRIGDKDPVVLANLLADVGHQRIVDRLAETSLSPRCL